MKVHGMRAMMLVLLFLSQSIALMAGEAAVIDAQRAIINVEDFFEATSQLAQTTLRSILGQHELDEMLARAATNQEREVDGLIATLLGILQPLLVIIMAGVVLVIVLAILLPIFEINTLIQ